MHKVSAQMPNLVAQVALAVSARLKDTARSPEVTAAPGPVPAAVKTASAAAPAAAMTASPRAVVAAPVAVAAPSPAGRPSVFSRLGPVPGEPQPEAGQAVEAVGPKAAKVKAGFTPYRPGSARKVAADEDEPPPGYGPEDRQGGERHPYDQSSPSGSRGGGGKSYLDR